MYPDIEITHQWSEEQLTVSCGRAVYLAGEQIEYEPRQTLPVRKNFPWRCGISWISMGDAWSRARSYNIETEE